MDLPEYSRSYTELSFRLTHIETKVHTFKSVKSSLRRAIQLAEMQERKMQKKLKKQQSLEKIRKNNPDIKIDEEAFLGIIK